VGRLRVSVEQAVSGPAETVYGYIADMREHHPRFLPPAFSGLQVESGGVGTGTVFRVVLTAAGAPGTTACGSTSQSPAEC